jgi:alkyl hydroperoxide reductase subunit F
MVLCLDMNEVFDVAILGGGPAGAAAAVYAARKGLSTVIITDSFGGQSVVSETIYNWIGTPAIAGMDLAQSLRNHVDSFGEAVTQAIGHRVLTVTESGDTLIITTNKSTYIARSIVYALGSSRRKLDVPGADTFEHKGLTYCASCDGPLFSGQDVVVVGGGNAGFESALQLLAYCSSVTLLHRRESFKADPVTIQKAFAQPHFKAHTNVQITGVSGSTFVSGITFETPELASEQHLPVAGIFVEIGGIPNTEPLRGLVDLNESGFVITDPRTQRTSHPRIWAAGDCTDGLYHQNNIAAGDAVKALEDLYLSI